MTGACIAAAAFLAAISHSRWTLGSAQEQLFNLSSQAEAVYNLEAQAAELHTQLCRAERFITVYDQMTSHLDLSTILATLTHCLPDSIAIQELDFSVQQPLSQRSPGLLVGGVSGFAPSDHEISAFIGKLETTKPFRNVTLNFTRHSSLNGSENREFFIGFQVDMAADYEVVFQELNPASASPEGAARAHRHNRKISIPAEEATCSIDPS